MYDGIDFDIGLDLDLRKFMTSDDPRIIEGGGLYIGNKKIMFGEMCSALLVYNLALKTMPTGIPVTAKEIVSHSPREHRSGILFCMTIPDSYLNIMIELGKAGLKIVPHDGYSYIQPFGELMSLEEIKQEDKEL